MTSKKQPQIPGPLLYNTQGTFHVSRELLLALQIDGGAWAPPKTPQQLWYDRRPIQTMLNARDYRKTPEPPEQGLKPVQPWARHLEQAVSRNGGHRPQPKAVCLFHAATVVALHSS